MDFPPGAFLIGAQKAGTTFLARLVDQQPGIALAQPKEPDFFTRHWEHGLDWYRQCFPQTDATILMDASTSYSVAPLHLDDPLTMDRTVSPLAGVPRRIREVSPSARFIYVLRDPVDRIWSAYWHDVRNAGQRLPLAEAIRCNHMYLSASDYLGQIRQYQRCFPPESFLFLRFEDLRTDPEAAVADCLRFLGVPQAKPVEVEHAGQHKGYRLGGFASTVRRLGAWSPQFERLQERIWSGLPEAAKNVARARLTRPVPKMPEDLRRELEARYQPMIPPLEEMTGLDLSAWPIARGECTGAKTTMGAPERGEANE